ncbi:MAG: hypothetical protein ACOX77_04150, partial [Caldicoprobacterales bacterium]
GTLALNVTACREGNTIKVEVDKPEKPWNVLLRNIASAAEVEGGTMKETPEGLLISANQESSSVKIKL